MNLKDLKDWKNRKMVFCVKTKAMFMALRVTLEVGWSFDGRVSFLPCVQALAHLLTRRNYHTLARLSPGNRTPVPPAQTHASPPSPFITFCH